MSRASFQVLLVTVALLVASFAGKGFPDGPVVSSRRSRRRSKRLGNVFFEKGGEPDVSRASLQIVLVVAALVLASIVGIGFPDGP